MPRKFALKLPKEMSGDESFLEFVDSMFTELGLSPQQAQLAADRWSGYATKRIQTDMAEMQAASDREVSALRKQWGSQIDSHIASGRKAASSLGLDAKALDALDRTLGIGATMGLLAAIGSRVVTDAGTGKSTIAIADPVAARAEIARLSGDRAFQDQLRDTKNPSARQDALAKWGALHAAGFPAPEPAPASPSPTPSPAPTPGKREAALLRIEQLRGDAGFQDRMRQPGPGREAAVAEWNEIHRQAHEPQEGSAS